MLFWNKSVKLCCCTLAFAAFALQGHSVQAQDEDSLRSRKRWPSFYNNSEEQNTSTTAPLTGQQVLVPSIGRFATASNCDASDFELPDGLQTIFNGAPLPPFITVEIFALVEFILSGWAPGLAFYETPIATRFTHITDVMHWNCVAMYSTDWKDALSMKDPLVRSPASTPNVSSLHNSPARILCMAHASAAVVNEWAPEAYPTLSAVLAAQGYNNIEYGFNQEVDAAFDLETGEPDLEMLGQVAANNCYSPKIMGAIAARQVTEYARRDGYNMYGDLNRDGTPCEENRCPRYTDPTGYVPVHGYGSNSAQKFRWQPMLEDNGRGYFSRQEHVTPHIGTLAKRAFLSDEDFERRVAPKPNYNYDEEAIEVAQRLKATATDDMKKAKIEFYDNKIKVTGSVIAAVASYGTSFEQIMNFAVGITASEYDSILVSWKEKVAKDLVRPTTWIQEELAEVDLETYGGPNQGVKTIKGKNFDAWVRVMPHSEYVSGSGCVCQAIKDFTETWMELTVDELNERGLGSNTFTPGGSIAVPVATEQTGRNPPFVKGSSITEPGQSPKVDLTLVEPNLTALRNSCGESRLDGGMHFSQSIPASYKLCEGIGTQGAGYAIDLLGGAGWG